MYLRLGWRTHTHTYSTYTHLHAHKHKILQLKPTIVFRLELKVNHLPFEDILRDEAFLCIQFWYSVASFCRFRLSG